MDAEYLTTSQPADLPLVKTRSIEWSGESMRPDLQLTIVLLSVLAVLIVALLIAIPAQLRSMTLTFDTVNASSTVDTATGDLAAPACAPRTDWVSYPIQPDDSLLELARRTGISLSMLATGNCLQTSDLQSANTIYLPAVPGQ